MVKKETNERKEEEAQGLYSQLGVSHSKTDVHKAIKNVDQGLFPDCFCKVVEDLAGDPEMCAIFHADGAGTKSSLAYMMYKETKNLDFFRGIVQDSVVMNLDDMLCVGVSGNVVLSNTIGRNGKLISGEIIGTIINEYEQFTQKLTDLGFPISTCGGETADVGDLVRTLIVDSTAFARMPRAEVILPERIQKNDVIVGLASSGQTTYEATYNSGIGSNGLTLARHGTLSHDYFHKYPMCYAPELDEDLTFFGNHSLVDPLPNTPLTIGEGLLSPTRTYAPLLGPLLNSHRNEFHALYHCTGGGQVKCKKFGQNIHYIKNDLFTVPPIFQAIQASSQTQWREMYQVFNMGHRMEVICSEEFARTTLIPESEKLQIDSKIIGHIEFTDKHEGNRVTINTAFGDFQF